MIGMQFKHNSRFVAPSKQEDVEHLKDISVVILADEMGYRMKSYGPKCLIPTNSGNNILLDQVNVIKKIFHNHEIILLTGFQSDKVSKRRPSEIRIVENQLHEETNSVEGFRLCLNNCLTDRILVLDGDLIFNEEAIFNITRLGSSVLIDSKNKMDPMEVGVTIDKNFVINFAYGLDTKWCKIVFLTGKELQLAKNFCGKDRSKMYLFEMLNYIIENDGKIRWMEPEKFHLFKVDSIKEYHKLKG